MDHFEGIIDKVCKDQRAKDKFQVLAPYFGSLTIDELVGEDLDNFPSMVNNVHKILMSVFVHRYLEPLMKPQILFRNEVVTKGITIQNGKINARGCFSALNRFDERFCLSKVYEQSISENSINFVDLSANNLLSSDLPHVLVLMESLDNYLMDNVVLSLENNRIHGIGEFRELVDKAVDQIVSNRKVGYIDMRINPFCTVDRKDFFCTLGVDDAITKKLIWIQDYNLFSKGWRQLLKSNEVAIAVQEAHLCYFKSIVNLT